ncbi:MAG: hypothetical protein V3T83_22310 [Acidobacteriota bacterium]
MISDIVNVWNICDSAEERSIYEEKLKKDSLPTMLESRRRGYGGGGLFPRFMIPHPFIPFIRSGIWKRN